MANKKTDVALLVRGMGMGMAFLQALCEEIVKAGGFEEMIHFLTKEHARPICKKVANLIVHSADWQIPRSLMERLAAEASLKDNCDSTYLEHDKRYYWYSVLGKFGVPIVSFGDPKEFSGTEVIPIPEEILAQIVGKPAAYPMIVVWEGEQFVVVGSTTIGEEFEEGEIVKPGIYGLWLASVRYFNLEQ